jgi:hypothetical protein
MDEAGSTGFCEVLLGSTRFGWVLSRDGKRLFISRRDCAMDCRGVGVEDEYYELILP